MRYLIFLDFDGVFTSTRCHIANSYQDPDHGLVPLMWSHFDPVAVQFMNRIHEKHVVNFVWMTTWGNGVPGEEPHVRHIAETMFRNAGFRGIFASPWKVNPTNDGTLFVRDRAYHVKDYLENYAPECEDFLLFDDTKYQFDQVLGRKRHIYTDPHDGLLYKHMLKAESIIGNWIKRNQSSS